MVSNKSNDFLKVHALESLRRRTPRWIGQWRWAYPTHESLARAGLTVSENSADEILETVKEVFALTAGGVAPSSSALIETWREAVSIPGFYGSALPSTYFLEKYRKEFFADVTTGHSNIDQAMSLQ